MRCRVRKNRENYTNISRHIQKQIEDNKIRICNFRDSLYYIVCDEENRKIAISMQTGNMCRAKYSSKERLYYMSESKGGTNKNNCRQYMQFTLNGNREYLLVNYVLMMALGLLSNDEVERRKSADWHKRVSRCEEIPVINHINGYPLDNSMENLEVTTQNLNSSHSRLMQELEMHYGNLFVERYGADMRHIKFVSGVSVSCKDISKFNKENPNLAIKRSGCLTSNYSKDEMWYIIGKLGLRNMVDNTLQGQIEMFRGFEPDSLENEYMEYCGF